MRRRGDVECARQCYRVCRNRGCGERQDQRLSGDRAKRRDAFGEHPVADDDGAHGARGVLAPLAKGLAPGMGSPALKQRIFGARDDKTRLVEQRRRIASRPAGCRRRARLRIDMNRVERGLGPRKEQPRERVADVVQASRAGDDLRALRDPRLEGERRKPWVRAPRGRDESDRPTVRQP